MKLLRIAILIHGSGPEKERKVRREPMKAGNFRFAKRPCSGIIQSMEPTIVLKIVVVAALLVAVGLYHFMYR